MALPSQKRTKSSKRRRASHFALDRQILSFCPKCKRAVLPHHVCSFCGTYKDREILEIKLKKGKKKEKEK